MNTIDYKDWNIKCSEMTDFNEISDVVERLNFKGYMTGVVGKDDTGKDLLVKTRAVNRLSELYNYDFSNCYLYKIEKVNYIHHFTPKGTDPWDYDAVELSKFDNETRYGYRVRFAGEEKVTKCLGTELLKK